MCKWGECACFQFLCTNPLDLEHYHALRLLPFSFSLHFSLPLMLIPTGFSKSISQLQSSPAEPDETWITINYQSNLYLFIYSTMPKPSSVNPYAVLWHTQNSTACICNCRVFNSVGCHCSQLLKELPLLCTGGLCLFLHCHLSFDNRIDALVIYAFDYSLASGTVCVMWPIQLSTLTHTFNSCFIQPTIGVLETVVFNKSISMDTLINSATVNYDRYDNHTLYKHC